MISAERLRESSESMMGRAWAMLKMLLLSCCILAKY